MKFPGYRLCRFRRGTDVPRPGLLQPDGGVKDLAAGGIDCLFELLEQTDAPAEIAAAEKKGLPVYPAATVTLLPPVDAQEIWAAGVTYLRSKKARMEESNFSATAYDRVYDAARPELFFKCLAHKVRGPQQPVGIRADARWNVPEPELALVINSRGRIAGYTIGNDLSARDIEGENLLYLPQAKIYDGSCALGPAIVIGVAEDEARSWPVTLAIHRAGTTIFEGATSVGNIKRAFQELVGYLRRSQTFAAGAILLTGTGIVPPDDFTLEPGDEIEIAIEPIGRLVNTVVQAG